MLALPIGLDPVAMPLGGIEVRWSGIAVAADTALAIASGAAVWLAAVLRERSSSAVSAAS